MSNSSRSPDNWDKLSKKYPCLQEIRELQKDLGPIRVRRKSPKEIESVLNALPQTNFNYRYYDCFDVAEFENPCGILFIQAEFPSVHVPVWAQTVIFLKEKENKIMANSMYLDQRQSVMNILSTELQIVAGTLKIKTGDNRFHPLLTYLEDFGNQEVDSSLSAVVQDYCVLVEKVAEEHPDVLVKDFISEVNEIFVGDILFKLRTYIDGQDIFCVSATVTDAFIGEGENKSPWNAWLRSYKEISKEDFLNRSLVDLSTGAGFSICFSDSDEDLDDSALECYPFAWFNGDSEERPLTEIIFAMPAREKDHFEEMYKAVGSQGRCLYLAYTI